MINFGELVELVHKLYFLGIDKKQERVVILNTVKDLTNCFNLITEYDSKYLTQKYSFKLLAIVLVTYLCLKNKEDLGRVVELVYNNENLDDRKFRAKILRKDLRKDIEKVVEGVINNV